MSTAQRVPETFELTGDDARETLLRTGRKTLLRGRVPPPPLRRRVQPCPVARVRGLARGGAGDDRAGRVRERARRRRRPAQHRPDPARDGTGPGRQPAGRRRPTGRSGRRVPAVPRLVPRSRRRARHGRHCDGTGRTGPQPHLRRRAGPPDAREVLTGPTARHHGRGAGRRRLRRAHARLRDPGGHRLVPGGRPLDRRPLAARRHRDDGVGRTAVRTRTAPAPARVVVARLRRHRRRPHLVGGHRAARLLLLDQLVVREDVRAARRHGRPAALDLLLVRRALVRRLGSRLSSRP